MLSLDELRELLRDFLGNTGGRRGREREQLREEARAEDDAGVADADVDEAMAEAMVGEAGEDGSEIVGGDSDSSGSDGTGGTGAMGGVGAAGGFEPDERPDPEDLDEDEIVDDLYHRIESLEEELQRNDAQLGTIQDSTEAVSSQVEEVNDTVRRLLGVYDQLTEEVNPFVGSGEEEEGFGLFEDEQAEGFGLSDREATATVEDGPTVSFADLKEAIDRAAEEVGVDAESFAFEESVIDDDDPHLEVEATESVEEVDETVDAEERDESDEDEDDVTLHTLADTFASDVIVFEWLTDLVRTAGPAATLRAISYYHEIGWIDKEVRNHLEATLSGPDLDIHVDPSESPQELTADQHADSYTYIMKLSEVHETKQETEL